MGFLKGGEPWQQPLCGQRGQRTDREYMVVVVAQQPVGGEPQVVERGADAGKIIPGFRRQRQCAVFPDEQANPQFLLKPADLMADRGLGDVQFRRGNRKAQMPGGSLERAQSIQRRQSSAHLPDLLPGQYMSLYHLKRHKVSFVGISNKPDILGRSLALGGSDVELFTANDDKSS